MTTSILEIPRVEDAQLKAVKNKIQLVLTHLIATHIKNSDGQYYEIYQNSADEPIVYTMSKKPPRVLAKIMLPYVLWGVSQYLKRMYTVELPVFSFVKKPDAYLKGVYHLDVQIQEKALDHASLVLLVMVVVFQDYFESTHFNKVAINRLCYLMVD